MVGQLLEDPNPPATLTVWCHTLITFVRHAGWVLHHSNPWSLLQTSFFPR